MYTRLWDVPRTDHRGFSCGFFRVDARITMDNCAGISPWSLNRQLARAGAVRRWISGGRQEDRGILALRVKCTPTRGRRHLYEKIRVGAFGGEVEPPCVLKKS